MTALLSIGLVLALALGLGRITARFHIPRVTGYLFAGLLAGPSMAHFVGIEAPITHALLESLGPLQELALGLIVLSIGGQFQIPEIRKHGFNLLKVSGIEMTATAGLVGLFTLLAGAPPLVAGFLALMAITTAPAATQMVVREYQSEGPLTDLALTLIGLNNAVAIGLFILLAHFGLTPDAPLSSVAYQLGMPLLVGGGAGAILALFDQRLGTRIERQILTVATVALVVGVSIKLGTSAMMANLLVGAVLVNASPHERRLLDDLTGIDYPLYVLFFVFAGAHLEIESLPAMGIIGVAYIVARTLGKFFGCRIGTRSAGISGPVSKWLGPAMLAQAGLAIGLAAQLAEKWPGPGALVQTAVLASVVIFEGVGPLMTRVSLVRAGEVSVLSYLSQRRPVGYAEGLHELFEHFRRSLGISHSHKFNEPSDILVQHVMRKNVELVHTETPFDSILKIFGTSRYDRLPIVDDHNHLIGVVQYKDVAQVLFEPTLRHLIVAGDIVSEEHLLLHPDDTLEDAMTELREHPDHTYLLVVDAEEKNQLVGVVRHNDVLFAQHAAH